MASISRWSSDNTDYLLSSPSPSISHRSLVRFPSPRKAVTMGLLILPLFYSHSSSQSCWRQPLKITMFSILNRSLLLTTTGTAFSKARFIINSVPTHSSALLSQNLTKTMVWNSITAGHWTMSATMNCSRSSSIDLSCDGSVASCKIAK